MDDFGTGTGCIRFYQSSYRTAGYDRIVGYTTVFARDPREVIVSLLRQLYYRHFDADADTIMLVLLVATFHLCELLL